MVCSETPSFSAIAGEENVPRRTRASKSLNLLATASDRWYRIRPPPMPSLTNCDRLVNLFAEELADFSAPLFSARESEQVCCPELAAAFRARERTQQTRVLLKRQHSPRLRR
jgi:hypothetical protein